MDSHVTVNVVEPGSSIPVPNTGAATMGGLSGYETGIVSVGLIVVVLAIIAAIATVLKKKNHKVFQTNKGFKVGARKHLIFGAIILLALCGAFGFANMKLAEQRGEVFAEEGETTLLQSQPMYDIFDNTITVSVSAVNIDVELEDEPVFAYAKSDVKVTTPTLGGYSLYMYADGTDLVNEKTGDKIKMLSPSDSTPFKEAAEAEESGQKLADNTWGVTPEKPTAKGNESAVWFGLPTSLEDAYLINHTDEATEANDTTTGYFGTYVTPELPYGTYKGLVVNYVAIANFVEPDVTFHYFGENVYFDEAKTQTHNAIGYSLICEDGEDPLRFENSSYEGCEWVKVDGKYKDPIIGEGQMLYRNGWMTDGDGMIGRGEEELMKALNLALNHGYIPPQNISLYGEVIDYFTITYDANGGHFVKTCKGGLPDESFIFNPEVLDNGNGGNSRGVIIECEEEEVSSITFKYDLNTDNNYYYLNDGIDRYYWYNDSGLELIGWSEDPNATIPTYYYDTHIETSPLMKGMEITLYAVWGEGLQTTNIDDLIH